MASSAPPDNAWQLARTAPENAVVETKIDDGDGDVRNVQKLFRRNGLWWFPDEKMYVYYAPTHWRPT